MFPSKIYITPTASVTCFIKKVDGAEVKSGFGRKVKKGHTKGQSGRADENVADDPRYHHAKLYTSTSLCVAERLH